MIPTVDHADPAAFVEALEARHAELSDALWRSPTRPERQALLDGAVPLVAALDGCAPDALRLAAARFAGTQRVELHRVDDARFLVVYEADPHGGALSAWRCGPAVELIVQAPHSHFDLRTGDLARDALLAAPIRGAMWNTTHRYRATPDERPEDPVHPADVCDQPASAFQAWSLAAAAARPARVVQLHGFAQGPAAAVLSSGDADQPPVHLAEPVAAALGEPIAVYGVDTSTLGGARNALASALPGRFLHLELAPGARARLASDPGALTDLIEAIGAATWSP